LQLLNRHDLQIVTGQCIPSQASLLARIGVNSAAASLDRSSAHLPNAARLLLDLQRINTIVQRFSGCLEVATVARCVTDGLVDQFGCAFARIWVVEPDRATLRLVASSGLYTHIDGSFARIPMGAYKVGKIAQNRVPFLSNQLAAEPWVKDRDWALANNIQGFAGYPLITGDRVVGVIATFSHSPMAAEFLEVLQVLCMTTTIALDSALWKTNYTESPATPRSPLGLALSDQLAPLLTTTTMALVGTERPLPTAVGYGFVKMAEVLDEFRCAYARLIYGPTSVQLEAIVAMPDSQSLSLAHWRSHCDQLRFIATHLGGSLETQLASPHNLEQPNLGQPNPADQQNMMQVTLLVPYREPQSSIRVAIHCETALTQLALTHLAYQAGLAVGDLVEPEVVVITDSTVVAQGQARLLWVRSQPAAVAPNHAQGTIDLSVEAGQLRRAVTQITQGLPVAPCPCPQGSPPPSDREREIMTLLAQGWRDRDIATQLYISESTVKFHINNSLSKLKAKNRYQAVYQAAIQGWI
jgi:DNA-binding CsgD family transcriptional regulator